MSVKGDVMVTLIRGLFMRKVNNYQLQITPTTHPLTTCPHYIVIVYFPLLQLQTGENGVYVTIVFLHK